MLATNIRAVSEFSGISYHKIRSWFLDGLKIYKDDNVICIEADVVRGKQRLSKIVNETKDNIIVTQEINPAEVVKRFERETKQPKSRNMHEFDDFFKEVQ